MKLKRRWQIYRKRRCIAHIRGHFLWFGFNLNDYSDKEIEQGIIKAAKLWALSGLTTEEAIKAFAIMGK